METTKQKALTIIGLFILIIVLFSACVDTYKSITISKPIGHKCKYKSCPFKGDFMYHRNKSECAPNADCYTLDSLHFIYPSLSYDELDSLASIK